MKFTSPRRINARGSGLLTLALGAMFGAFRPAPRGMALNIINVGRNNQRYPIKDIYVYNPHTANTLSQGSVVCMSWTADGTVHTALAGTSFDIINSHQKGIVMDATGIPPLGTGRIRVQGPVNALLQGTTTYADEDVLIANNTGQLGTNITLTNSTLSQTNTGSYMQGKVPSPGIGFVPAGIGAALTGTTLKAIIFDGTAVNAIRYQ